MKENQVCARSQWSELLEKNLGYLFREKQLLTHALMHASWANEHDMDGLNNERLEFLGDAVLELCVTEELYRRYPALREGALTEIRSRLVSEQELAKLGRKLGIDCALLLGVGEEKNSGRCRDSTIADAFEAVLAAVFKDGGFESARQVVQHVYKDLWPATYHIADKQQDAKSRLQQLCQKRFKKTPTYYRIEESGPDHEKAFRVKLVLPDGREFMGYERSAKRAEHAAAALALAEFGN